MRALLVAALAWIAVVSATWLVVLPWLRRGPGRDVRLGLLWRTVRLYAWFWHRLRVTGRDKLPRDDDHGGLIVVSNHTGALDPLVIQAPCRFFIRWMMASDMMGPNLDWLWEASRVIPVDRENADSRSLREAIRHVQAGGALGVFPEGRITIPPRELRPFLTGIGMIVRKTGAPVLLAWVRGTPDTNRMSESLRQRGHAGVTFIDVIDYSGERDVKAIAEDLRRRLHEVSGWPYNEQVIPPGGE
jgi:1-acyl-sn-glycerol-3-phosphate acyltransferase